MGKFIAEQTIKQMIRNGNPVKDAKVNVLGLTFKEDVPDLRNSHVIDVINERFHLRNLLHLIQVRPSYVSFDLAPAYDARFHKRFHKGMLSGLS